MFRFVCVIIISAKIQLISNIVLWFYIYYIIRSGALLRDGHRDTILTSETIRREGRSDALFLHKQSVDFGETSLHVEVRLQFLLRLTVVVGYVANDVAVLQKGYARTDVDRVVQVVARDEDGCARLLIVLCQQVLDDGLRRGVEEIEGLVENEHLWP